MVFCVNCMMGVLIRLGLSGLQKLYLRQVEPHVWACCHSTETNMEAKNGWFVIGLYGLQPFSRWWQLKYFRNFRPDPCKKWSNLTIYFFSDGLKLHQRVLYLTLPGVPTTPPPGQDAPKVANTFGGLTPSQAPPWGNSFEKRLPKTTVWGFQEKGTAPPPKFTPRKTKPLVPLKIHVVGSDVFSCWNGHFGGVRWNLKKAPWKRKNIPKKPISFGGF